MAERLRLRDRLRRLAPALAALTLLAGLGTACSASQAVEVSGRVVDPPFKVDGAPLEDTDGQAYSLTKSTDKRLTMVFFGYTNCPDLCPAVMSNLASAMTRLDGADRKQVDVVFVSTDPARDTPQVLRKYLDRYDPSFIGVTTTPDNVEEVATIARSVAVGMGDKLPSGGYDSTLHSTQVTAIDSDDEAPMYWSQSTSSAQYAADIHALLNG